MADTADIAYSVEAPDTLLPFLLTHVKGASRNTVKALLSRKQVMVDGLPVTQFDTALAPGQTVSLLPKGVTAAAALPFKILYEDEELIVIDKPAGLLSIASDKEKEMTAYHILTDYVRGRSRGNRIFVLHRLDRDTSGVLVFAKTEEAKRAFQDNWEKIMVERAYLAAVEGSPEAPEGTVTSFLRETPTHLVYSCDHETKDSKKAVTHYKLLCKKSNVSLLYVTLDTGRKNQIRVHMKDLGCPVVGDKKYEAKTSPISRMALHALTLRMKHPVTGQELAFTAPVPSAMVRYLPRDCPYPVTPPHVAPVRKSKKK